MIDHQYLKQILHYNPNTGLWTWLQAISNKVVIGNVAGTKTPWGYIRITVHQEKYMAHRLAWFYMTGEWPPEEIDHKDLVRDNNKWDNLRLATSSQNKANRKEQRNNTSGHKGIDWDTRRSKWRTRVADKHIGYYDSFDMAVEKYRETAKDQFEEYARGKNDFTA